MCKRIDLTLTELTEIDTENKKIPKFFQESGRGNDCKSLVKHEVLFNRINGTQKLSTYFRLLLFTVVFFVICTWAPTYEIGNTK